MVKHSVTVTIDREVLDKIEEISEEIGMSRSKTMNELLRDRLKMRSRFSEGILREGKDLLEPYWKRD